MLQLEKCTPFDIIILYGGNMYSRIGNGVKVNYGRTHELERGFESMTSGY